MSEKIAVISCWWNEEKLAKLFLKSHSYADQIFIFSDVEATDRSRDIAAAWPNTTVEPISMPNGFDDQIKVDAINKKAQSLTGLFDWVVAVDSDELVTCDIRQNMKSMCHAQCFNLKMYNIYRHKDELDFDPDGSLSQRNYYHGIGYKPCIAVPRNDIQWNVGCHSIPSGVLYTAVAPIIGEHWGMADPEIAIDRRLARRARMSKNNLQKKWGIHCFQATEENIRAECAAHLNGDRIPGK